MYCPVCGLSVEKLGVHIRQVHGESRFRQAVVNAKLEGVPDATIGARFGISFHQLEQIITEACGANVSVLARPKPVKSLVPKDFHEESTSVWSFRQRGNWATHDGRYRGNWSPYIPRNVILKYSNPGDLVLDYFVGGGTTAVEAKLLGRRCIARDINPSAVYLTRQNLRFDCPHLLGEQVFQPQVSLGDARDLSDIPADSVDLICAHPPYAGIISYSTGLEGDLSSLAVSDFLAEMGKVARESFRVLRPGGKCAILIGDARKEKHVVPVGFQTIRVFLDAGFALRELVIKRQYNCRTTGFWYARSIKHNFLLLAHEYLPVFEKPTANNLEAEELLGTLALSCEARAEQIQGVGKENLETTTVWVFPGDQLDNEVRRNLQGRFLADGEWFMEVRLGSAYPQQPILPERPVSLVFMPWSECVEIRKSPNEYYLRVGEVVRGIADFIPKGGFLVLEARDFRRGGSLWPMGLLLYENMAVQQDWGIKEIVIVVPEDAPTRESGRYLDIIHRYLLVYVRR